MIIKLKKYGQVTRVTVDDHIVYDTAVTPRYESMHIRSLLSLLENNGMQVGEVQVVIEEKE